METLKECPICSKTEFSPFINAIDFTVSKKEFSIVECKCCGFKFTNPRPTENEMGPYYKSEDYVSHSNTSKGFINGIYQIARKFTLAKKLKLMLVYSPKKGALLDIGCGTGEFLNICKLNGFQVLGIEPSTEARGLAKSHYNLDVRQEDAIEKLEENSYDIITMWHVLEHVSHLNERIIELKRILKPNGTLIVAVPNCTSLDAEIYKEHWAAYDVPRHLYHFRPQDIKQLFQKHEMSVIKILPMTLDSFYVSMLSEKIKYGKTNFIKAIINGFRSNMKGIKTGMSFSSQIYILKK